MQESDEQWDQARALTAQAQKEGRIAQVKTVEASATKHEASESMRRVEIARGAEHELQVCPESLRFSDQAVDFSSSSPTSRMQE